MGVIKGPSNSVFECWLGEASSPDRQVIRLTLSLRIDFDLAEVKESFSENENSQYGTIPLKSYGALTILCLLCY